MSDTFYDFTVCIPSARARPGYLFPMEKECFVVCSSCDNDPRRAGEQLTTRRKFERLNFSRVRPLHREQSSLRYSGFCNYQCY